MKRVTSDLRASKHLSYLIAVVLILMPFYAFITTWASAYLGINNDLLVILKEALLILITPVAIWLAWRSQRIMDYFKNRWLIKLFALYILLHLILGAWSLWQKEVNGVAYVYSLIINLRFIIFFLICLVAAEYYDFLRNYWREILLWPAGVVILFALLQKFVLPYDFLAQFGYGGNTIPAYQTVDSQMDLRRVQSTLRGSNPFGVYLVLVVPAILLLMRKNRIYKIIFALGGLVALFFSYSRSAWIGLAAAGSFLSGFRLRKRFNIRRVAAIYIIFSIGVAGSIYGLRHYAPVQETFFHDRPNQGAALTADDERWRAIRQGAGDVAREPLGRGPGTAGPASFRNNSTPRIAENYYLQIGQEIGLAGMLLFIAINVLVGMQLWVRRSHDFAKLLLASLIGVSIVNLFSHAWTDDTLAYLWWGLAGIALAPTLYSKADKRSV